MAFQPYGMYQPMYQGIPDMRQYQPPMQQAPQQPMQQPTQQQPTNSIIWVQGEEGAKAYMVAPGNSVLLMDSEDNFFFIKSVDQSGMPSMRKFAYQEITGEKYGNSLDVQVSEYVEKTEFENLKKEVAGIIEMLNAKKPNVCGQEL